MRQRLEPNRTHDVLVRRRVEVEAGDPDDPFVDDETTEEYRYLQLVDGDPEWVTDESEATLIPVVLKTGGSSYVRGDTGERVEKTDSVRWPTGYLTPKENDRIVFDDIGERIVESVAPKHGRHGVDHFEVELGGT